MTTPKLIAAAIRAAVQDTGRPEVINFVDSIAIVDALSRADRPAPLHPTIVAMLGITPRSAVSSPSPSGNYPIRFLEDAANAIAAGTSELAIVAGGEAMRSFTRARNADSNGTQVIREYRSAHQPDSLKRYGLIAPVEIYPLYEQATRHAWRQTLTEARAESGAIWEGNARIAAGNPYAWIRDQRSASTIVMPSCDNPMISFPYTRSMVANSAVNQGAALLVTSLMRARTLGLHECRLAHIGYGAAADEASGTLDRADYIHLPAMEAVLDQTLARNGITAGELEHVELYSCFPCVPKMARRAIGWPLEKPHSIYGGLTFGGGPIGNCMTHAVAALVRRIREGSRNGLIFANGGFATRNHAIVLTERAPDQGREARDYDVQSYADRLRGPIPYLIDDYRGPGEIESYTVPFSKNEPRHATIIGRTPDGARFLARVPASDASTLNWLMSDDHAVIGAPGHAVASEDGLVHWRAAATL